MAAGKGPYTGHLAVYCTRMPGSNAAETEERYPRQISLEMLQGKMQKNEDSSSRKFFCKIQLAAGGYSFNDIPLGSWDVNDHYSHSSWTFESYRY